MHLHVCCCLEGSRQKLLMRRVAVGTITAHETFLFILLIMALRGTQRLWSLCGKKPQFVALIMTLSWLLTPSLKPPSSVVNTGQLLGNRELTNKLPVILEGKNKDVI